MKANNALKDNLGGGLTLGDLLRGNLRQYVMVIALVMVIIFFQMVTEGILLKP